MPDKKPLYQPWNEDEFRASVPVQGMTHVQRWMYRTLLQSSFFYRTSPYLPNEDKVLWVLAGAESIQQWIANKETVLAAFDECTETGLIGHRRVISDWERVVNYRKKMKELSDKAKDARKVTAWEPGDDRTDTEGSPHANQKKREEKRREESKENESEVEDTTPSSPQELLEQLARKRGWFD